MTEVINNQRKIKLDWRIYQPFTEKAVETVTETGNKSVTVAFVSDRKMKRLNYEFRGKKATTDVLSFPFETGESEFSFEENDSLGDIVISVEQAEKQAAENNLSLEKEIKQLILHGILHLCGFDHETDDGEMNSLELQYRDKLKIS